MEKFETVCKVILCNGNIVLVLPVCILRITLHFKECISNLSLKTVYNLKLKLAL